MKKFVLSVVAAVAVAAVATPVFAADMAVKAKPVVAAPPPSPWDIAFGSALMTDYIFRGVTQSAHNPSVAAYFEPRYNLNSDWQLYAGVSGESIKFANAAAAEIDFYGGVRPTFGPLALDFGIWEYYYPGGTCFGSGPAQNPPGTAGNACLADPYPSGNVAKRNASFYEVYAKATYTMGDWAFGPTFYYTPNYANLGADGEYLSGIVKYTAPASMALWNGAIGWYASGEFGHQWLGTSDAFYGVSTTGFGTTGVFANGIPEPDYNTWNVGLGFTWKVFTLDLRYSDTDLSKTDCSAFTSDPGAKLATGGTVAAGSINPLGTTSRWCGSAFTAKLSADLTLGSLK